MRRWKGKQDCFLPFCMSETSPAYPSSKQVQHKEYISEKLNKNEDRKHQYRKAESLSRAPFFIFSVG